MPLTSKGQEIMVSMKKQYGSERGERVFYASKNKGRISGVDRSDALTAEEVDERVKKFKRALQNREITAHEYEGLLKGLSKVASKKDADPPIPADYGLKLDAAEKAMVRLGSRMDALEERRRDADDTSAEKRGVVIGGRWEMPR